VPSPSTQCQIFADDYSDDLESVDSEGCVPVPEGPGLGVTINWDWVRKHQTATVVYE
jgi:L-alanine-DL-glutamate epimerase-like enolase superfamily enzyme